MAIWVALASRRDSVSISASRIVMRSLESISNCVMRSTDCILCSSTFAVPFAKLLMALAKEVVSVRVHFLAFYFPAMSARMHEAYFGEK